MAKVTVYASLWCPFCVRAMGLLKQKSVAFRLIDVDKEPARRREMIEKAGRTSVPQIFFGDEHIGGCDELMALERRGVLDSKLANL